MESSEWLKILYEQYSNKIHNLAFRMTGNRNDADDITQDTFIEAIKSIDKFRGESQIYTWLYKIAKNKCLKLLERRNKSTFLSLQELIDKKSSPIDEEISEAEKMNYIVQVKDGCLSGLLRCLSLQQRLAFILNVLLDLPLVQVANIIGKTDNATRILVHRAKQNIRDFLCRSCSLYDAANSCRCENLINFSLKQGWITRNNPIRIEAEISELKSVIRLYKTLQETSPSKELQDKLRLLLTDKQEEFLILGNQKVK